MLFNPPNPPQCVFLYAFMCVECLLCARHSEGTSLVATTERATTQQSRSHIIVSARLSPDGGLKGTISPPLARWEDRNYGGLWRKLWRQERSSASPPQQSTEAKAATESGRGVGGLGEV